jgi:hypothetical protein
MVDIIIFILRKTKTMLLDNVYETTINLEQKICLFKLFLKRDKIMFSISFLGKKWFNHN